MKERVKVSLGLAALVVAALMAVAGIASATPPNDPNNDFVTGGFQDGFGFDNGVSAQGDPSGANPKGHLSATHPSDKTKIRGDIVCIAVSGNTAATGIIGTLNGEPYKEVEVYRDGGPGGTGDGFTAFEEPNPSNCQARLGEAATAPSIVRGDILINDAQ
jgi:hypothetical protein